MNEQLWEHSDSRGVAMRVDRIGGVIHGVKILGKRSRNRRRYRTRALAASIPLYEGARVNVNHPKGAASSPRDYEDRIGAIRNVRARRDGLYGDFHFNPKHRLAEQLVWDAQHAPENVGFSHNVVARTSRQADQTVIEEIVRVQSVDLVADPATTDGLFEHVQSGGLSAPQVWDNRAKSWIPFRRHPPHSNPRENEMQITVESLKTDHPQLYEQLRTEILHELPLDEQRAIRVDELETLRAELEHLKEDRRQTQHKATVDALIAEAQWPVELVTETFRERCYAADTDQLDALLEDRREIARTLAANIKPRSIEQHRATATESAVVDGRSLAAAIR